MRMLNNEKENVNVTLVEFFVAIYLHNQGCSTKGSASTHIAKSMQSLNQIYRDLLPMW